MKKRNTLLLFFLAVSTLGQAQLIHQNKMRYIRYRALSLIDQYEQNASLSDNYQVDYFRELFQENSMINNDVLPDNNLNQSITLEEYDELLYKYHPDPIMVSLRPYRIKVEEGALDVNGDDVGIVYIDTWKTINAYNKDNCIYDDTLDLRFEIEYNITDTLFTIKSIENNYTYGKYVILEMKNGKKKDELTYDSDFTEVELDGKKVTLNRKGEVFLKNITEDKKISITPSSDNYFQTKSIFLDYQNIGPDDQNESNHYKVSFRKKLLFIRPNASFFSNKTDVVLKGTADYSSNIDLNGFSYGADIGILLFKAKKIPLTLNLLAGIKATSIDYSATSPIYSQSFSDIDASNDSYQRTSTLNNLHEDGKISFLQLPLTIRVDYQMRNEKVKRLGFYAGAGGSYLLNTQLDYTSKAGAHYKGIYGPEYYNIEIGENGVYDFGYYDLKNTSNIESSEQNILIKIDFGASLKINKRLTGELGVSYWNNLNNLFADSEFISAYNNELNSVLLRSDGSAFKVWNIEIGLKYYL